MVFTILISKYRYFTPIICEAHFFLNFHPIDAHIINVKFEVLNQSTHLPTKGACVEHMESRGLTHSARGLPPLLQSSSSASGFQPGFQNSRLSSQIIHSESSHVSNRKARASNPLRLISLNIPSRVASLHSTCILRICLRASSGLSKFNSHASLNSEIKIRLSFSNRSSIGARPVFAFRPNGHQPMTPSSWPFPMTFWTYVYEGFINKDGLAKPWQE